MTDTRTGPVAVADTTTPTVQLIAFTRMLTQAGVPVSTEQARMFLRAAATLDAGYRDGLYWAGRATLCTDPADRPVFDEAFGAWFDTELVARSLRVLGSEAPVELSCTIAAPGSDNTAADDTDNTVLGAAAAGEVLRHRDIAELDASERSRLWQRVAALPARMPQRSGGRRRPAAHGRIDVRATLDRQRRRHGEMDRLCYQRTDVRVRPVTWLIDVSGSMAPYAEALLRLAHRLTAVDRHSCGRPKVETLTVGTRLTRVTSALRWEDSHTALDRAGEIVPDWSGGTQLADTIGAFVRRWAAPGLTRGGITVICSDGWERGDAEKLREQVGLVARLSHRLIWLNPHRGKPGYRPVQDGIAVSLPHCDRLVAGHTLAAFEEACAVIADA